MEEINNNYNEFIYTNLLDPCLIQQTNTNKIQEINGYKFETSPNQKVITIQKAKTDIENIYAKINIEALAAAAYSLQKKVSFKLWLYFAKNQDGYAFALSSASFMEWAKCSRTAYDSAVHELIEKGYLIPKYNKPNGNKTNSYIFREIP